MTCKTCRRDDINEINALIFEGKPLRYIVDNFGIPNGSIQRHKEICLPELFEAVRERQREGLLGKIDQLERKFLAVENEFNGNWQARIAAGAKQIDLLDKEAKLTGAYIQEATNPADIENIAERMAQDLVDKHRHLFPNVEAAKEYLVNFESGLTEAGTIG